jgi:hypothetical protein
MATFSFDSMTLIFDAASDDVAATVGFESDSCDRDFKGCRRTSAIVHTLHTDKGWGVRTAYLKGLGELNFEIEGPLANLEPTYGGSASPGGDL